MKKTAISILFIFTIAMSCGMLKEKRVKFLDGKFSITKPATWTMQKTLHNDADLQMGNLVKEAYLIILSENKSDFAKSMTVEKHSAITRGSLMKNIVKGKTVSGPKKIVINGFNAVQYELRGQIDNVNIIYLHTTIETKDHFHQVLAWSLPSKYNKNLKDFHKAVNSIKQI